MNNLLESTIEFVEEAGQAIMAYYNDSFSVTEKSPDNPVTEADIAADTLLKERLLSLLPEAGWLSEETADSHDRLDRKYCWVVDRGYSKSSDPRNIHRIARWWVHLQSTAIPG